MALRIRRVVTGHDEAGRSYVTIDDDLGPELESERKGMAAAVAWATDRLPADNMQPGDPAPGVRQTSLPQGSVFRIIEYQPGVAARRHRTSSIDYAIVLSGEIWMLLDEGEVLLKAGDMLVQRGTLHNWENRGTEPCVIAFILIGAAPVHAGGKALPPIG
jgi:quercetin dioxygenase-like cupin family protein